MEQIRIIKEMRNADKQRGRTNDAVRCRFMVWENVPGALSSNGGADFQAVLEETAKVVETDAHIPESPKGGGHMPDTSWGTDTQWLGGCTIVSGGAYPRDAKGSAWLPISMDTPQCPSYLILDMGEKPNEPMPTKLSEILEEEADPKYNLSARACQGILNRASRRGKVLPEILKQALEAQAVENGLATE